MEKIVVLSLGNIKIGDFKIGSIELKDAELTIRDGKNWYLFKLYKNGELVDKYRLQKDSVEELVEFIKEDYKKRDKLVGIKEFKYKVWVHPSEGGSDYTVELSIKCNSKKDADESVVKWLKKKKSAVLNDFALIDNSKKKREKLTASELNELKKYDKMSVDKLTKLPIKTLNRLSKLKEKEISSK